MRSNLIALRKELGLTQKEFGLLFKKSSQHISNIENNRENGSTDMWLDIGLKFNLSVKQVKKLMEVS